MVWFPNSWFYFTSRKKCIVAMFSCFKKSKKNIYWARSLVKLISKTPVYICHKNMKSMGFFLHFLKVFAENIYKIYFTGNEEWIESETVTITCDYVVTWVFHRLTCRQNKCTSPEKKNNTLYSFYFSLTLRDTEIFLKLLLWSDSWVTAPVFHNQFLIFHLYLMTVVIQSEQRMPITP